MPYRLIVVCGLHQLKVAGLFDVTSSMERMRKFIRKHSDYEYVVIAKVYIIC